jgi:hypothetical protein
MARVSSNTDATVALSPGFRRRRFEPDVAWSRPTAETDLPTQLFRRFVGREPTIVLGDADIEEIRALGSPAPARAEPRRTRSASPALAAPAVPVRVEISDSWSIDILVDDAGRDARDPGDDDEPKGFLWWLLRKLGWIKRDEELTPLGA